MHQNPKPQYAMNNNANEPQRQSVLYPKDMIIDQSEESQLYELAKEEELRIEICKGESVKIIVSTHIMIIID